MKIEIFRYIETKCFFSYILFNLLLMKVININDGFEHISVLSENGQLVHF